MSRGAEEEETMSRVKGTAKSEGRVNSSFEHCKLQWNSRLVSGQIFSIFLSYYGNAQVFSLLAFECTEPFQRGTLFVSIYAGSL